MAVKKEMTSGKDAEKKFTKEQMLKCEQYRQQSDLLSALLADGQRYSLAEVEKLVQEFLEKEM